MIYIPAHIYHSSVLNNKMKKLTEQQVDDLLKLKFGALVASYPRTSHLSNKFLGKLFGVSGSQVRRLYMA